MTRAAIVCLHCGLVGHNRTGGWVRAERRWRPDDADRVVADLIPSDIKAITVADLRRNVARALRAAAGAE